MNKNVIILMFILLCAPGFNLASACFGPKLKIGVSPEANSSLASYAIGFLVEEKTGIAPEFIEFGDSASEALKNEEIDIFLASPDAKTSEYASIKSIGDIPGVGPANVWIRTEMKDDLRFFTVERALGLLPQFFSSSAYKTAAKSKTKPKKAARQAVLNAD